MSEKSEGLFGKWNKQIVRVADVEFRYENLEAKEPPEKAIRMTLVQLLIALAHKVEQADSSKPDWFPMEFPMRLTLQSETLHWDFQLQARLMNSLEIEEDNE